MEKQDLSLIQEFKAESPLEYYDEPDIINAETIKLEPHLDCLEDSNVIDSCVKSEQPVFDIPVSNSDPSKMGVIEAKLGKDHVEAKPVEDIQGNLAEDGNLHQTACELTEPTSDITIFEDHFLPNLQETAIYRCNQCFYETRFQAPFSRHLQRHQSPIKCSECDFQVIFRADLKRHMEIHKSDEEIYPYRCDKCDFKAKIRPNLMRHLILHQSFEEVEKFPCTECGFVTIHKSALQRHLLIHQNKEAKIYKCEFCPLETIHSRVLKRHLLVHFEKQEESDKKCNFCGFKTTQERYLRQHTRRIHENVSEKNKSKVSREVAKTDIGKTEMYQCYQCNYRTPHKRYLKDHVRCHTSSDVLYKCSSLGCKYETPHRSYMLRHFTRVHKKTGP